MLLHERAGLPAPATIPCSTTRRGLLRSYVERLGGFPVVLKVAGGSGGLGVMRADSFPALFSLVDFLRSKGYNPLLTAYVPDAVHWRLVVVGSRVAAAYKNVNDTDAFRTHASDAPEHTTCALRRSCRKSPSAPSA
jgi:glutathione synthase/RimK-type ligase-like ATP-grasp enzyme